MLNLSTKTISNIASAFAITTMLGNYPSIAEQSNIPVSQTLNHAALQSFARKIDKKTYATRTTKLSLGNKIFNKLPAWSGNKPVFVLRLEDFGRDGASPKSVRQKLIEIGMPQNLIPASDVLKRLSDRINLNKNQNYYAAAFPLGAYGIMIGISDSTDMGTKSTVVKATGFPADIIEHFPASKAGHKEVIYKHEAGHIKRHIPVKLESDRTRSEIIADQNVADIDGAEWQTKDGFDQSFSIYHVLMAKTVGLVHIPGQDVVANTIPNVYMPWETRPQELEGKLLFENNSLQNLRPIRIKIAEQITDRAVWRKGLDQLFTAATGIKHIPEAERAKMAFIAEYILPQNVINLVWKDNKYQGKNILHDFDNSSLDEFIRLFRHHPDFIDALKERTGYVTLKENKNKTVLKMAINAANERLAEISSITIEKRFLEKYLEAVQYYFPQTYQQVIPSLRPPVTKAKTMLLSPSAP